MGAVKTLCFTTGYHFDDYRKLNIKNPLFIANGGFFVFGEFGAGRGMDVLLRWLWEWQGSMQQSLSLATDRVKRILTLMKSQNVAIYNKK